LGTAGSLWLRECVEAGRRGEPRLGRDDATVEQLREPHPKKHYEEQLAHDTPPSRSIAMGSDIPVARLSAPVRWNGRSHCHWWFTTTGQSRRRRSRLPRELAARSFGAATKSVLGLPAARHDQQAAPLGIVPSSSRSTAR